MLSLIHCLKHLRLMMFDPALLPADGKWKQSIIIIAGGAGGGRQPRQLVLLEGWLG